MTKVHEVNDISICTEQLAMPGWLCRAGTRASRSTCNACVRGLQAVQGSRRTVMATILQPDRGTVHPCRRPARPPCSCAASTAAVTDILWWLAVAAVSACGMHGLDAPCSVNTTAQQPHVVNKCSICQLAHPAAQPACEDAPPLKQFSSWSWLFVVDASCAINHSCIQRINSKT
jgi:hypothetical protein